MDIKAIIQFNLHQTCTHIDEFAAMLQQTRGKMCSNHIILPHVYCKIVTTIL